MRAGMAKDVKEAERALARGRPDEALVYLWNAVEPARVAGDTRTLERIGRVAQRIARGDQAGEQREAQRLLELLRSSGGRAVATAAPATAAETAAAPAALREAPPTRREEAEVEREEIVVTGDWVPDEAGAAPGAEPGSEGQRPRGGLGRFIVPLVFLLVILVNVINRLVER